MLQVRSCLDKRIIFSPNHMAPVPESVQEKETNELNYVMNPPMKVWMDCRSDWNRVDPNREEEALVIML